MSIKNQRTVYVWVNILINQVYKYMNGSIFSMARYMIGVGFRNLGHTPVPQLPLSYPPPPPPPEIGSLSYLLIFSPYVSLDEVRRPGGIF